MTASTVLPPIPMVKDAPPKSGDHLMAAHLAIIIMTLATHITNLYENTYKFIAVTTPLCQR